MFAPILISLPDVLTVYRQSLLQPGEFFGAEARAVQKLNSGLVVVVTASDVAEIGEEYLKGVVSREALSTIATAVLQHEDNGGSVIYNPEDPDANTDFSNFFADWRMYTELTVLRIGEDPLVYFMSDSDVQLDVEEGIAHLKEVVIPMEEAIGSIRTRIEAEMRTRRK